MTEYESGTCNINQTERKKRLVMGIVSFANSAILTAALLLTDFTAILPGIFLLNLTGFMGLLQYRYHFCAGLALRKKFHIGDSEQEIEDSEMVTQDRKKAASIIIQSLIGSSLLTVVIYLVMTNF